MSVRAAESSRLPEALWRRLHLGLGRHGPLTTSLPARLKAHPATDEGSLYALADLRRHYLRRITKAWREGRLWEAQPEISRADLAVVRRVIKHRAWKIYGDRPRNLWIAVVGSHTSGDAVPGSDLDFVEVATQEGTDETDMTFDLDFQLTLTRMRIRPQCVMGVTHLTPDLTATINPGKLLNARFLTGSSAAFLNFLSSNIFGSTSTADIGHAVYFSPRLEGALRGDLQDILERTERLSLYEIIHDVKTHFYLPLTYALHILKTRYGILEADPYQVLDETNRLNPALLPITRQLRPLIHLVRELRMAAAVDVGRSHELFVNGLSVLATRGTLNEGGEKGRREVFQSWQAMRKTLEDLMKAMSPVPIKPDEALIRARLAHYSRLPRRAIL